MYTYSDFCSDRCYKEEDPVAKQKYASRLNNIERQKKYRKRHRDNKAHINMLVDREITQKVELLATHYGVTRIKLLENLINAEEKLILTGISNEQRSKYFGVDF